MKKPNILIVEDEVWLAEQHARVIKKAGYEPTISPHALSAIAAIDDIHPEAIILDVLLTGSTAFAFLHELQSYTDTADIPIILCTNIASDIDMKDLKSYGVRRVLDKTTMEPDDLVTALRSVLA
jgi:DNA-binding response OmpR family regulator